MGLERNCRGKVKTGGEAIHACLSCYRFDFFMPRFLSWSIILFRDFSFLKRYAAPSAKVVSMVLPFFIDFHSPDKGLVSFTFPICRKVKQESFSGFFIVGIYCEARPVTTYYLSPDIVINLSHLLSICVNAFGLGTRCSQS